MWDGARATGPALLDMTRKIIDTSKPEHLAWLADVVNKVQTVEGLDPKLAGYTVNLLNNINLNNLPWTPVGHTYNFSTSATTTAAINVGGIVGYCSAASGTPGVVENCHFDGTVKVSTGSSSSRLGGLFSTLYYMNTSGCSVSGEMDMTNTNSSTT